MDKPDPKPNYQMVGVTPSGLVLESRRGKPTPPSESLLIAWGHERRCGMVMRYFPSRKGWRILDIRNVRESRIPGKQWSIWKGQVRGQKYYPTKEAAIMVALHTINCPA